MKVNKKIRALLIWLCVAVFWLLIWAAVSFWQDSELLFPSPLSVLRALGRLCITREFWLSALTSLWRVLAGILISFALGTLLAVLTEKSKIANAILAPLLGVIKATPVASFIILALLWITRTALPIFITALIVIPIVWSNVSEGIRSVDSSLIEVTRVYGFTARERLFKLYVPSVAPFFMASCKSSLGMAWKAGISAEVLSTPQNAIGTELYFSKTYLETPDLFAWTLVVIILSVIIEKLLVRALGVLGQKMRVLRRESKT